MQLTRRDVNVKNMIFGTNELFEVARDGFLVDLPESPTAGDILCARSVSGDSLLHVACARGHLNEVKILLDLGMPIDDQGDYGYTPLHYAAEAQSREIYKLLIDRGCNPLIHNLYGDLALSLFHDK